MVLLFFNFNVNPNQFKSSGNRPRQHSQFFDVILFLCVFSPFSIAITSLWEERANLSAFHMFVRFAHVWFCLFPLPLGVWEGLWLVIVTLP